jgi:hypothetical protein
MAVPERNPRERRLLRRPALAIVSVLMAVVAVSPVVSASAATPMCTTTVAESDTTVAGTEANDVICILGDRNTISALGGDDTVIDSGENNTSYLGDGNDTFDGSDGDGATVSGGAGDDDITGTPGDDTIDGGEGADDLGGAAGDDDISGEAGPDSIDGGVGSDTLNGGAGNDALVGGEGGDTLNGGEGDDDLAGNAGPDNIYGEAGTDTLTGGDGDDIVVGGEGIDYLDGGSGTNLCDGLTAGEVATSTCLYDDSAPTASVTVQQTSVSVGYGPGRIDFSAIASDGTQLGAIWVVCRSVAYSPRSYAQAQASLTSSGTWQAGGTTLDAGYILSGTRRNVTFAGTIYLPVGSVEGQYNCGIGANDAVGNSSGNQFLAFTVTRDGVIFDDQGPVISAQLQQTSVDVSSSNQRIDVSIQGEDESGIRLIYLTCWDPTGVHNLSVRGSRESDGTFRFSATWNFTYPSPNANLVVDSFVGDAYQFSLTMHLEVVAGVKPGMYSCGVSARDTRDNEGSSSLTPSLQVIRNGDFDDLAPAVTLSFTETVLDVGWSPAALHFSLVVTDQTSFGQVDIRCRSNQDDWLQIRFVSNWDNSIFGHSSLGDFEYEVVGSDKDFAVTGVGYLAQGVKPGVFTCSYQSWDQRGNFASVGLTASFSTERSPAALPSAPSSMQFQPDLLRPTSGVLEWVAPTFAGRPALTDYRVQYSRDGTTWSTLADGVSTATRASMTNLATSTDYWFRVRGENGLLADSADLAWTAPLKVTTPVAVQPDAPTTLTYSGLSSSTVSLNWVAPDYNGGAAITTFAVETSRDNGVTWNPVPHPDSTSVNFSLSGLAPGTDYRARVAAVNSAGTGQYISTSFRTTQATATAPLNLRASNIAATSLTLTWDLPLSNGGSPITNYQIEFSSDGGSAWSVIPRVASTTRTFNVTGLMKGVSYRFRVSAVTFVPGSPSNVITALTLQTVSGAPTTLLVDRVTSSGAVLGWTAPIDTGGTPITDYRVETSRDNGKTWTAVPHLPSASTSFTLSGLAPGTAYAVRVSAVNRIGVSTSLAGSFTTQMTVPSQPLNLRATKIASTSVTLAWDLPASNGGSAITDYTIRVSSNDGETWTAIAHRASTSRTFVVSGLTAAKRYQFTVSAVNSRGTGPATAALLVTTP